MPRPEGLFSAGGCLAGAISLLLPALAWRAGRAVWRAWRRHRFALAPPGARTPIEAALARGILRRGDPAMPTVCINCTMRALLLGEPSPVFDEEPDAHARRVHPDLAAAQRERKEMEAQLQASGLLEVHQRKPRQEPPA